MTIHAGPIPKSILLRDSGWTSPSDEILFDFFPLGMPANAAFRRVAARVRAIRFCCVG